MPSTAVYLVPAESFTAQHRALSEADADPAAVDAALRELAAYVRINALGTITSANHGWLGASLSAADVLTVLYFGLGGAPGSPTQPTVVLGKGHAAAAQYACLAGLGLMATDDLRRYKQPDGPQAHADITTPGVEINTGSLGQALSKCCGLALARPGRIYAILGDGELQEGQNYEAFMTLHQRQLGSVVTVIDRNRIQSDSNVADIKAIPDLEGVLRGFGLDVRTVDGHDPGALRRLFTELRAPARPTVVIADTRKGAGISFMASSDTPRRAYAWHGRVPSEREYRAALRELRTRVAAPDVQRDLDVFLAAPLAAPPTTGVAAGAPTTVPELSTGQAFSACLPQLVRAGHDLVVLDADLEKPCRLGEFAAAFPERFLEMGIAEQDMVSCAGGLARRGRLPVVNTYAVFYRRAFEQLYLNATERTRIVYAGHYAGLCYTTDGRTHQCTGDLGMMRSVPGLHVLYPAFAEEVPAMLQWYLNTVRDAPLYLRLHRTPAPRPAGLGPVVFRFGWGTPVLESGAATTAVLTSGPHLATFCAEAIAARARAGRDTPDLHTVSTLRFLAPDYVLGLTRRYSRFVIVEETAAAGGLFDEIGNTLATLQGSGRLTAGWPRLYRRAVDGLTFSTRDPLGLYRHFGLDPQSLAEFLDQALA